MVAEDYTHIHTESSTNNAELVMKWILNQIGVAQITFFNVNLVTAIM